MRVLLVLCLGLVSFLSNAQLSVKADVPSILRTGDYIEIPMHISNLSDKEATGQIQLLLVNKKTNTSVDGWMQNVFPVQHFSVSPKEEQQISFPIKVPMEPDFHQLKFYAVIGTDTSTLGEISIATSFSSPLHSKLHVSFYVMKNGEMKSIEPDQDVSIGDTVIGKGRVVTDKKNYPRSVQIEAAANSILQGDTKTYRKMNVLVFEQSFIITHAGSCGGVIFASTSGVQKPLFISYNLSSKSR